MTTVAGQFFGEHDCNSRLGINSADALWTWVSDGGAKGFTSSAWTLHPGEDLFFRGQPNVEYSLSSSLYRICKGHTDPVTGNTVRVDEQTIARAEQAILDSMREQGLGRLMTDGELLAVLQHHGIPTRLIDVSTAPLEALFFAVDQEHGVDGRLFAIHLHHAEGKPMDMENFAAHDGQAPAETALPWQGAAYGKTKTKSEWTERVALVDQAPLDSRMHAQRGRFLVGGLNKRYGGRSYMVDGLNRPGEDFPDISTLGVNFLKSTTGKANTHWPATGWTIRVDASWKPDLLGRLASVGITTDSMYPPHGEVRRLALKVAWDAVAKAE